MYQQIAANKRRSALLILGIVGLFALLGYVFSLASQAGAPVVIGAVMFSLFMTAISWWGGDRIALIGAGAKPLPREAAPELHRIVENLAITAGLPKPAVYLIPDTSLNAFATGRDPAHASIAVTRGLVERLDKAELEGVLAHELSHVGNYDTRYLMLTAILVGAVVIASDFFLRSQLYGGNRRRQGGVPIMLIGLALAILTPLLAKLIQLAVSRRREFLADASGALLTRYPQGLSQALKKIAAADERTPVASDALAPLYFANPFGRSTWHRFFSTHPPITERITALEGMAMPSSSS